MTLPLLSRIRTLPALYPSATLFDQQPRVYWLLCGLLWEGRQRLGCWLEMGRS